MNSIPESLQGVLSSDPEILGGAVCFVGTRVPLYVFLDSVAAGISQEEFEESFPRVTAEQRAKVLLWLGEVGRAAIGLDEAA
jgi:uncharacterized protein (DUF433 family)